MLQRSHYGKIKLKNQRRKTENDKILINFRLVTASLRSLKQKQVNSLQLFWRRGLTFIAV